MLNQAFFLSSAVTVQFSNEEIDNKPLYYQNPLILKSKIIELIGKS